MKIRFQHLFPAFIFILSYTISWSQGVGIGTTTPDSTAILDLSSTTKGALMPRMTTVQRDAIVAPAQGLMIINLDDLCVDIWNGMSWIKNCGVKMDTAAVPGFWSAGKDFGPGVRTFAVGLSIGQKGYVGLGRIGSAAFSDFWEYDLVSRVWTQRADFEPGTRYQAVGFSIGQKGYVGTGNVGITPQNDFWEYDPALNDWVQKASLPGLARSRAVGFSIGNKGYIGTGVDPGTNKLADFWEYDPGQNSWVQKASLPGAARGRAVGIRIGNKGYIGTGAADPGNVALADFWEYDPAPNTWTQKADIPGGARLGAFAFSMGNKGYVGAGVEAGVNKSDFWEFDPSSNSWIQRTDYPGGVRNGAVSFSIGNIGFAGTGQAGVEWRDFWEYHPYPVSVDQYTESPAVYQSIDPLWTKRMDTLYTTNPVYRLGLGLSRPGAKLHVHQEPDSPTAPAGDLILSRIWNSTTDTRASSIFHYYDTGSSKDKLAFGVSGAGGTNGAPNDIAQTKMVIEAGGNVGIGTSTPNASAILDLSSTTKGMLMPRMTTAQRDAIVSPAPGLMIINLDDLCLDIWNGMSWIKNCGVKMDTAAAATLGFWSRSIDFGGGVRATGVGFSIGQKGYVGTGRNPNLTSDFWEYDPMTRVWTQKASMPDARAGAVGFSIGQKGYVGLGHIDQMGSEIETNDLWEYDPALNAWVEKASLPAPGRARAVGFCIGSKGYVGTGRLAGFVFTDDFWEYDPVLDAWVQKASFPGGPRYRAIGMTIGNKGYIGTGTPGGFDFWEYDPALDTWAQKADMPGGIRTAAFAFSIGDKGYAGAGLEGGVIYKSDFWEYNPASDSWSQRPDFGGGPRSTMVAFCVGNIGYAGTGFSTINFADFWEYHPHPVSVDQYSESPSVYLSIDPLWTKRADTLCTTSPGSRLGLGLSKPGAKLHIQKDQNVPNAPAGDLILSRVWNSLTDTRASAIYHFYDAMNNDYLAFGVSGGGGPSMDAPNAIAQTKMVIQASGNVGIGNTAPSQKLHVTGKIRMEDASMGAGKVLTSDADGVGTWTIESDPQVISTTTNKVPKWNGTALTDGLLFDDGTNIGIGNTAPSQKLHVTGKIRMEDASMGAGKVLTSDANGVGTWTTESDPQVTSATTNKIPKWNGTTLTDGLILDDGNKVGFNINTPNSRLHIHDPGGAQNAPSADLVLSRVWNSNTDTRASAVFHYYSTASTKDNLAFGVSGGGGTNEAPNAVAQIKMIIQADGFVGIGNTAPEAPLHVGVGAGITTPTLDRAFFHSTTGPNIIQNTSSSGNIQIRADGYYWANGGGYVATSDGRIKNIRHTSDSEKDLSILNQIKITDYTYIDSITNGNTPQKKVIAQQLQSVYPQAVNSNEGIIPNVFEVALHSEVKDSVTIITTNKPHTFAEGDEVKLILEGKGEQICHVHVIDARTFTTDHIITEKIFVYGKKVDDLLNVDYDAVSMLNVSATQELSRQMEQLRAENAKQQAENTALKSQIDTLKAEIEDRLKALEARLEKQMQ